MTLQRRQFSSLACIFQFFIFILFSKYAKYTEKAMPSYDLKKVFNDTDYPLFQDIHVMVFVGFGFLMAFLKRYGFSAVSVNLLLSAVIIQWALFLRGVMSKEFRETGYFSISIADLMISDLSCVVVIISMGVLLGRLTPTQFLLLSILESSFSIFVEFYLFEHLHINDGGRALVIHTFAAYFGLAVSKAGYSSHIMDTGPDGSISHSELFSMIGTLFLWIFFPSFNAAEQDIPNARMRAILNTYLSMASCTVMTFLLSSITDKYGRFNMIHIQSSTLAGGIAVGTVANVIVYPRDAILVGMMAGCLSVVGHAYISPRILEKKLKIYDTCGVHNLHGLPGLLSGIMSVVFVLYYDPAIYGNDIEKIYPYWKGGKRNGDRDKYTQAYYQSLGIIIVMFSSIILGYFTGFILRLPCVHKVNQKVYKDNNHVHFDNEFQFLPKYWNSLELSRTLNVRLEEQSSPMREDSIY
uniref:Ammonium_transp domain-containing protein n=1 Tax=Strongyloides papillosus TaxID=174720 RepID=A0A0N5BG71_STREA